MCSSDLTHTHLHKPTHTHTHTHTHVRARTRPCAYICWVAIGSRSLFIHTGLSRRSLSVHVVFEGGVMYTGLFCRFHFMGSDLFGRFFWWVFFERQLSTTFQIACGFHQIACGFHGDPLNTTSNTILAHHSWESFSFFYF